MSEIVIPKSFENTPYAKERFRNIVKVAANNHPFYKERLSILDKSIPLLTRSEILDNNKLLLNGYPVTARTSGSTDIPVELSWSDERLHLEKKIIARYVSWLGGEMKCSRIIHMGDRNKSKGCIDITSSVEEQVQFIQSRFQRLGATAVTTYPTNAENLCLWIIERGINMSFIKRFGCYGEVFEPHQESLINQAFPNAQVWTTYSSMELGIIAGRCPHEPEYHHIFAGKLGVEVIDDAGNPCKNDEIGRLVMTDYFNARTPFIRYEIGDLAAKGECPCGKINLPALSFIGGKVRGALVNREGVKVPFTYLSGVLRDLPGMRQYQVIQHEIEVFEVRYVTGLKGNSEKEFCNSVTKTFNDYFGYSPTIRLTKEQEIKREANGKFYASISYV
jgi:phenylacetate-coenzyme A ligase PaaK-like adenylate-forming protein